MIRALLAFAGLLAIGACASPRTPPPALKPADLLSGAALPAPATAPRTPPTAVEIFSLDDEMRAFVRQATGSIRSDEAKLRRLLAGMHQRGLFALDYDASITRTATDTFHTRQANCLSFTVLFVALAREAGLDATYQMVDIPPVWSSHSDVIILASHINALVETSFEKDFVVDFNLADSKGNYDKKRVDDQYALALFYSNVGVDALLARDYASAFVHLRAAIASFPELPGAWINLGLLYSRQQRFEHAEASYLHALELDPHNRSALTNLASLYTTTGKEELAAVYRDRVRQYQQRNPYYHYSLAQRAYRDDEFSSALDRLKAAIRLKRNEHQFHFLEALTYYRLGDRAKAERSLSAAREYAQFDDIKTRYSTGIEALAANDQI